MNTAGRVVHPQPGSKPKALAKQRFESPPSVDSGQASALTTSQQGGRTSQGGSGSACGDGHDGGDSDDDGASDLDIDECSDEEIAQFLALVREEVSKGAATGEAPDLERVSQFLGASARAAAARARATTQSDENAPLLTSQEDANDVFRMDVERSASVSSQVALAIADEGLKAMNGGGQAEDDAEDVKSLCGVLASDVTRPIELDQQPQVQDVEFSELTIDGVTRNVCTLCRSFYLNKQG